MSRKRLSQAICSLIRRRDRTVLPPLELSAHIGPSDGVAYQLTYETAESSAEIVPIEMESGLLVVPLLPTGAADPAAFPLHIYCGETLQDYFDGPGSLLPGHSVPSYTIWTQETIPPPPCIDWVTAFSLDGDKGYTSRVYDSIDDADEALVLASSPIHYSGLLRLLAQARLGRGLPPLDVNPGQAGLFRDRDYRYWLIEISAAGCTATRMQHDPRVDCVRTMLAAGAISDPKEQTKQEAVLLSAQSRTETVIDVLSAGELEGVYGDKNPFVYEWAFSRQIEGVTQASIITFEIIQDATDPQNPTCWWEMTLSSVQFDVTNHSVSASVTVEEPGVEMFPDPATDAFFVTVEGEEGPQLCWMGEPCNAPTPKGPGPCMTFYLDRDDFPDFREVARYQPMQEIGSIDQDNIPLKSCSAGSAQHVRGTDVKQGGFTFDSGLDMLSISPSSGSANWRRKSWWWDAGAEVTGGITHHSAALCNDPSACGTMSLLGNHCAAISLDGDTSYTITATVGTTHLAESYYTTYGTTVRNTLIFHSGREAATFNQVTEFDEYTTKTRWKYETPGVTHLRWDYCSGEDTGGSEEVDIFQWLNGAGRYESASAGCGGSAQTYHAGYSAPYGPGSLGVETLTGTKESLSYLVTPQAETPLDDSDPQLWADVRGNVTKPAPCHEYGMPTITAYVSGDKVFWPKPNAGQKIETGYEVSDATWQNKKIDFAGGA